MATHDNHSDEATVGFDEHHGPGVKTYLLVFTGLAVATLISFVTNRWAVGDREHRAHISFAIIMAVSVVKTCLVGTFFMHLIVDWRKLYYLLIPAFILGTMMMIVLMPDIVLAWHVL